MSYIGLRGRLCNIIDLNAHETSEEKNDSSKDSFYKELQQAFDDFPKCHMNIMLGDFSTKLGRDNILKLTIGNESLHGDSNDNGFRIVNFATSKNLVVKIPHRNLPKYTRACPDRKTHNHIDHILI